MKLCCGSGRSYETISDIEKLGCYSTDHCVGPITVEDFDLLLTGLGTFNLDECLSTKDLCKLLDKPDSWQEWIASQIKQEGIEKYLEWYGRMSERGAVCDELIEAHNKLFNGEEQ